MGILINAVGKRKQHSHGKGSDTELLSPGGSLRMNRAAESRRTGQSLTQDRACRGRVGCGVCPEHAGEG